MEKYCTAGQAKDDNVAHALCMLHSKGYTYTHPEYVILVPFPQQQYLHERASVLVCKYITCIQLNRIVI